MDAKKGHETLLKECQKEKHNKEWSWGSEEKLKENDRIMHVGARKTCKKH